MDIKITINTDNAAFHEDDMPWTEEAVRILRRLANRMESAGEGFDGATLMDVNGNKVGDCEVSPED